MTTAPSEMPDANPEPIPARRFGVLDALVLILGLALALSFGLQFVKELVEVFPVWWDTLLHYNKGRYAERPELWPWMLRQHWRAILWRSLDLLEVSLWSMAPAFLLLRARAPRPPWRTLFLLPSTVAVLVVVVGRLGFAAKQHGRVLGHLEEVTERAFGVGLLVLTAWAALIVSRNWRAERTWIDRMGRLIGVVAIASGLLSLTRPGL
jgi:hypothetical protein